MIRPLRRQHRVMIAVLAVTLMILFVAGLLVRPSPQIPNNQRFDRKALQPPPSGGRQ